MKKSDKKHTKRIRSLIVIFALTAIIISVSTYAWFIGMRTVNVTSFDVEIAATDSLSLSLDGISWSETAIINESNFDTTYATNTNSWGGDGLVPMSSVGVVNNTTSRLELYEKASLTATPGGYRLLASLVDNTSAEPDGYVAFDLFVRNLSGAHYYTELDEGNEEAIYLTTDSSATVSSSGVAGTGIENSVRVAFAQIGRVKGNTGSGDAAVIQGISCATAGAVTGICRTAQIWEPNDTSHVQGAINWYETSCLSRKASGTDVTLAASYDTACNRVIDGVAYPTYAIKSPITSGNNVDIYDGQAYNTYASTAQLDEYDFFTDSMKDLRGTARPTFMSLAPNSITKIRVYIYIEGQDIDNYDFSSIGKSIAIKFGFAKQRFTEDDIDYQGPDVNQGEGPTGSDLTVPVIKLNGGSPVVTHTLGTPYTDLGATAEDNIDGDITANIVKTGTVNVDVAGKYTVTYKVTDAAGNVGVKTRTVIVEP